MVAIVTGAAKRVGRAIALELAKNGYDIIVHYNTSEKEAFDLKDEIESIGQTAYLMSTNFQNQQSVKEFYNKIHKLNIIPTLLVNSASIFNEDHFTTSTEDNLEQNMRINSFVPLWLIQEFVTNSNGGTIINILDTKITTNDKMHFSYHLSKRNLYTITKNLALELAPHYRVNGIALGAILPPVGKDATYLRERAEETPLKIVGSVKDVTDTILFLENAKMITGEILFLDGGFHLKGALYGIG